MKLIETAKLKILALCPPELAPAVARMEFLSPSKAIIDSTTPLEFDVLLDLSRELKRAAKTVTALQEIEVFPQGSMGSHSFYLRQVEPLSDEAIAFIHARNALRQAMQGTSS